MCLALLLPQMPLTPWRSLGGGRPLGYLAPRERAVGDIVISLRLGQPSVSKHLRVLRDVGLVHVRREGRQMLYRTNAEAIKPLHEWASTFERFWQNQLNRIKERAEKEKQ